MGSYTWTGATNLMMGEVAPLHMLISRKHRYVYIAIPKTGSASMRALLRKYDFSEFGEYHDVDVPDWARDFTCFTLVRHPHARLRSYWCFEGHPPFEPWLASKVDQSSMCRAAGVDLVLKLEEMPDALVALPFLREGATLGHIRKSGHPECVLSEAQVELARSYCQEDFEQFGY